MTAPPKSVEAARQSLLDQIASITTMHPGTLAEEWREHPAPSGEGKVRVGPYFKHQVWKDGRNISGPVPADEALRLREDIDNARHFARLTGDLARVNIADTLALRAAPPQAPGTDEGIKNSTRKQAAKNSPHPKPSSRKPKRP